MKKRKDGLIQSQTTIKMPDGTKVVKYVYGKTENELEKKKRRIREELLVNGPQNHDLISVKDYTKRWLARKEKTISDNTYASYNYSCDKIIDALGSRPMIAIKRIDLQDLIDDYADKPRTAQTLKMTLNQIFESAIADEIIDKNPCKTLQLPKYKANEKRPLNEIEKKALFSADFSDEDRLFVMILYYTGLRRGEALALSRDCVDLENRRLTVRKSVAYHSNTPYLKEPKSAKSARTVPIPDPLYNLLKDYEYDEYLFTRNGRLVTQSAYVKMWKRILRKMNDALLDPEKPKQEQEDQITDLTAHTFRHNYATVLFNSEVSVKEAQHLLGHSTINVTMDIYTHLEEAKKETVEKINNYFADPV